MSSTDPSSLVSLNSSTLGAQFPEITLPDGTKKTGTVGALLVNIKSYNALFASVAPDTTADAETVAKLQALEEAFGLSMPLLVKVGLFDLFAPEEWIGMDGLGSGSVGRKRVGELAREYLRSR